MSREATAAGWIAVKRFHYRTGSGLVTVEEGTTITALPVAVVKAARKRGFIEEVKEEDG